MKLEDWKKKEQKKNKPEGSDSSGRPMIRSSHSNPFRPNKRKKGKEKK